MTAQRFNRRVIRGQIETTYGIAPSMSGTDALIFMKDVGISMEGESLSRDLIRSTLGNDPTVVTKRKISLEGSIELAGSGVAGTAPQYAPLLRACGFAMTINAGVSVVFNPISTGFESITLDYHLDQTLFRCSGARGNVSLVMTPGSYPQLKFKFTGLEADPSEVVFPTDAPTSISPVPVEKANTTGQFGGYTICIEDFNADMGLEVVHRDIINCAQVMITDRKATGAIRVEMPTITEKDYFALERTNTLVPIALTHGTVAGNIIDIAIPKAQLGRPKLGETDGIANIEFPLSLVPNAGNDELQITVR